METVRPWPNKIRFFKLALQHMADGKDLEVSNYSI
jgi:hypothetical protein